MEDWFSRLPALIIRKEDFSWITSLFSSASMFPRISSTSALSLIPVPSSSNLLSICPSKAFPPSQTNSLPSQTIHHHRYESTGCYHLNLLAFLSSNDFACAVFNPLTVKNFASLRKTKTDKIDARIIATACFTYNIKFLLLLLSTLSFVILSEHAKTLSTASQKLKAISKNCSTFFSLNSKELPISTVTLSSIFFLISLLPRLFKRLVIWMCSFPKTVAEVQNLMLKNLKNSLITRLLNIGR